MKLRPEPVLAGAGGFLLFLACLLGATPLEPLRVLGALLGLGPEADRVIVHEIRLPRALAAWATGFALGTSGAALQGLLRNPLADPGVLGVSPTAALAASVALLWGAVEAGPWVLPLAAAGGALGATAVMATAALHVSSVTTLILLGVGLSSFATALMALAMNLAPHPYALADMVRWMLGSVANRSVPDLVLVLPAMAAGCALLWAHRAGLSVLTLGEEAAAGAGLGLVRQRLAVVLGAGLATGAAVALAGAIGFVGIVAPHIVRPWVDHDPGRTLIPAGLLAGALLVAADIGVRLLPGTGELMLGVVAALFGAPVFFWIALRRHAVAAG